MHALPRARTVGPAAVGAVGVAAFAFQSYHLLLERAVHALAIGVLVPMVLSILLIAAAVWLSRSDLDGPRRVRVAGWMGIGLVAGLAFGYPVIPYQAAHGIGLVDVSFMVVNWLTVGALGGVVVGFYDARQRRYRAALEDERVELERENERLQTFASILSHDLRNPLNVATARTRLARETGDSSHLEQVADAHERMADIVDDVLTMARQGGAIEEHDVETVSLADLCHSCWATIETGDATLTVESDLGFRADESRVRHVLENLFRNALDHAEGAVELRVGATAEGEGFYVEDDGPGIPADQRDEVFEPGFTTDAAGTGYGLYIVETIAGAHGWDVAVTDAPDGGTRFVVSGVDTTGQ